MINSRNILRLTTIAYAGVFVAYLIAPLLYMLAAAFNSSSFPTLLPWQSFTIDWFARSLHDGQLWAAVGITLLVAGCVIVLSIALGLGGALLMMRMHLPGKNLIYAVLVSPILIPGIVIGLSTAIFWNRAASVSGFWGLSVLGQTSFIGGYCMLVFMARLQRADRSLEEAALDLGAGPFRVFTSILLPFLAPAMWSAAALAFLQSIDNYNTTLFTIGRQETLTVYIAGKMRLGIDPTINAVACMLVGIIVIGAAAYEWARRREARVSPAFTVHPGARPA
jgi:spermidine/putrescine transport system permease protein